jgi:dihydropteroate synthase-like protein
VSAEKVALITGSLAEPRLARLAEELRSDALDPVVVNVGVKVAALMTTEILDRRLKLPESVGRAILPGRFRGDLDRLKGRFGVPFERGPEELADLPAYFGRGGLEPDLSAHDCAIFAEIVEATTLSVDGIVARAQHLCGEGADVIDLGCMPDTPFPHLEDAIAALKRAGIRVSVDSADDEELARANRAGADHLLSLSERNLAIADEGDAVPILVPATQGDMPSLFRAVDAMEAKGRAYFADPILDPIHFGFTDSIVRYAEFRRARPDAPMLMGIGNVTELTDADTTGINAILMGIISELGITAVLAVEVSPHCRTAVREFDRARREFFAARRDGALPKGYGAGLMALRDRRPVTSTAADIEALAREIRDRNFRIEVSEVGVHIYNRDGHRVAVDPFEHYPHLNVEDDGAHAFYLGVETARAEIAFRLGKRYAQDEGVRFGVLGGTAESLEEAHRLDFKAAGATLARKAGDRVKGEDSES